MALFEEENVYKPVLLSYTEISGTGGEITS
jgi:hypothetical protein